MSETSKDPLLPLMKVWEEVEAALNEPSSSTNIEPSQATVVEVPPIISIPSINNGIVVPAHSSHLESTDTQVQALDPEVNVPAVGVPAANVPVAIVPLEITDLHCLTCLKSFSTKSSLQRHVKQVHNPQRDAVKYQCVMCDISYIRKGDYFKHFKKCHPNIEPPEPFIIACHTAAKRRYHFEDNVTPKISTPAEYISMHDYIDKQTKPKQRHPAEPTTQKSPQQPAVPCSSKDRIPPSRSTLRSTMNMSDEENEETYQKMIDDQFEKLFNLFNDDVQQTRDTTCGIDYTPSSHYIVELQH